MNKVVDRIINFKSNALQDDQEEDFFGKHALQARFFIKNNAPQARFWTKS